MPLRLARTSLALLLAPVPAAASAARPLDTEDTGTTEPGRFELEVGAEYERGEDAQAWSGTTVLGSGVLADLEVRVEGGGRLLEESGAGARGGVLDTLVGVKYRLLDETPRSPALLLAAAVRFPTAREGLGDDDLDVLALLAASRRLGPLTVTANTAYRFAVGDRDRDVWVLAASLEYAATGPLTLVAELVHEEG